MKTGRNSNKGFSLVELIIVIAIMAVVAGLATLSVSLVTNKKVSKCADEIVSTMERARVLTLGKAQNNVECIIYDDGSGRYMAQIIQGGSVVSEREIGKSPIKITVYFDNSTSGVDISAVSGKSPADTGNGLHVIFDRSSGAFVESVNGQGKYCTKIEVTNGNKTVNILPVGKTGKITKE